MLRDSSTCTFLIFLSILFLFQQVFGHLFPPFFKNWWSDDWISTVYGAEHTFRSEDVTIKHNVNAQKTSGLTRYNVDQVSVVTRVVVPFRLERRELY